MISEPKTGQRLPPDVARLQVAAYERAGRLLRSGAPRADESDCEATAAAERPDHVDLWATFGHVCERRAGHDDDHRCRCGRAWGDA